MKLKVFKCSKCGTVILNFDESELAMCCNENMVEQIPNSVDASFEKHVPTYIKEENKVIVEVHHVMEEEHYIDWILALTDETHEIVYLEPGVEAKAEFELENIKEVYAYCNKHGLWKTEIK